MVVVEFPFYPFNVKQEAGKEWLFDEFRKCWVVITPEEWVRQRWLQYLVQTMRYPASLIAVEKEIKLGDLRKRFDILVYDQQHAPWMMIECKATSIKLDIKVLEQLLHYHISIPTPYLVVSNGHYSRAFGKREGKLIELERLPFM